MSTKENNSNLTTVADPADASTDIKSQKRDEPATRMNLKSKKVHITTYKGPEGEDRSFIQAREDKLFLDRDVGKKKLITDSSKESESGGYWCDACKCSLKDNKSWLDHINGRKHQQRLGNLMRVERVDAVSVKEKFAALRSVAQTKLSPAEIYMKRKQERQEQEQKEEEESKKSEDVEDEETKLMREMIGFTGFVAKK